MARLEQFLKELTSIAGPSGYENDVANFIANHAKSCGKAVKIDTLGNVICQVNSLSTGPRVAVFAHMDEIGFIVRRIEAKGFLRVARLGGIEEKTLAGREVFVLTERGIKVPGVIGVKSHHLMKPEEKYTVTKVDDVYIDVGAANQDEVRKLGIDVGNPVVFSRTFFQNGFRVFANSLDNRAGCAVLVDLIKTIDAQQLHAEVYLIGSVQEEFSLRGILPVIRTIRPDLLICLDIAPSCDTPDLEEVSDVSLGNGPTINTYSFHGRGTLAGLIPRRSLVQWVERVASEEKIPLQRNVFFGGLTDASYAHLENEGILSVEIGFAVRYSHSPVEVCDLRDLSLLENLVLALLYRIDEKTLYNLREGHV